MIGRPTIDPAADSGRDPNHRGGRRIGQTDRPSNEIYSYLLSTGQYQVFPVNPTITEIDGAQVYPRLADLPVVPDMVDVFRRFDDLPSVLAETLALRSVRKPYGCKKVCGTRTSAATPKRPACRWSWTAA